MAQATIIQVPPLLDIESAEFAKEYETGVWWSMHGEREKKGQVAVSYLVNNLKRYTKHQYFDTSDPSFYRHHIGFYLGMYHGGILSPHTGQLRPDVTTLAILDHLDAQHGYRIGREAYFHDREDGQPLRHSESSVLDEIEEMVREGHTWKMHGADRIWAFAVGDILGVLSGSIFPETPEEQQQWQQDCRYFLGEEELTCQCTQVVTGTHMERLAASCHPLIIVTCVSLPDPVVSLS